MITETPFTLAVPIREQYVPNLNLTVLLTGLSASPGADSSELPAMARGDTNLEIPPHFRELSLDLQMKSRDMHPGDTAEIQVRVTNASGEPMAGAEVVLLAVDEAILALTGYEYDHPLATFYPQRNRDLTMSQLRSYMQSEAFVYIPPFVYKGWWRRYGGRSRRNG